MIWFCWVFVVGNVKVLIFLQVVLCFRGLVSRWIIKEGCVLHHCLHSVYLVWRLKIEEAIVCLLFQREMWIFLHQLWRFSLQRYMLFFSWLLCRNCVWLESIGKKRREIYDSHKSFFILVVEGELKLTSKLNHVFLIVQMAHPYKYAGENVEFQGLNVFKVWMILVWWLCEKWLSLMLKARRINGIFVLSRRTGLCSCCQKIVCVSSGSYTWTFQNLLLLCIVIYLMIRVLSSDWFCFKLFQGRVNVADIIGFTGSEMISSKTDG